jgi:hypothetical protein
VFEGSNVFFMEDGYINATKAAKMYSKKPETWLKTEQTQEYIEELLRQLNENFKASRSALEQNQVLTYNDLVHVKHGGNHGGTWIHPELAVVFGRWLSVKFAIWCDQQIKQLRMQQSQTREEHIREQIWKLEHDPIVEVSFQTQMSYVDRLSQRNFTFETFQPFFGLDDDRHFSMRLGGIINVNTLGISAKRYRELVLGPEGYETIEGKRRRDRTIITDNLDNRLTRDVLPKAHQECIQKIATDLYRYFRVRPNWTQSQVCAKAEEFSETHKLNTDLLVSRNLHDILAEGVDSFAEFTAQHHISPYTIIQQNLIRLNYDHVALERDIRQQQSQALSAML